MHRSLTKLSNTISASLVISRKFAIVTEILSSIQLMHIILLTTLPAEQTNLDFLKQITALPTLDNFVIADLTILIIIVSLLYFLVRIFLTIRISIQISRGGNKLETNISKTLAKFCIVHSRVLFFIFMHSYFAVISNYTPICSDHSDIYHHCGTGWFVLAVILSVLNAFFAFTQEFFLYRINKNQNAYAAKNNHIHKIALFQKFFSLISYFFFQETALKAQITSVIHLAIIIFALCIFYTTLPFYNMQLLKIVLVMTAINFSLSAVSIVYAFDNEIGPGLLISCIIMILFHWLYFKKILQRILEGGMETPQKAIHFAVLMKENNLGSPNLSLFKKEFKTISLFASGYMQKEGLDPFKVKDAQSAKEYENQVYEHIIKRLTFLLNRNPTSESLALYIANLYLKRMKNIFMASNFLRQLADRELGIAVKNSLQNMYIQLKNTCDRIYAGNRMNLELKDYLEYKEKTEMMKKDIDLETSKHIQFWQELGNKKLSIIKVYNLASDIDKLESRILSKYNSLKGDSSAKYMPSLLVYATYLQIIKEVPYEATKIFKTLQTFAITRTASHAFDVYDENSCIVTFSINKGQLGTIIDASASIQNLFHISKSKLLGGALHRLLPTVIAEKYTCLLGDAIKNPLYSPESFTTYAKTNNREYFEVTMRPQMHFHFTQGLILIVIFTKTSNPRSVIIVDEWNRIQEYSVDLKETLNLEDNKQTPYRLNDILPGHNAASSLLNSLAKTKSIEGSPRTSSPNGSPSRSISGRKFSVFRSPTDHSKQNLEDSILFSASHIRSRNNEETPFIGSARRSSRIHFQTLMLPELSDGLFSEIRKRFKEDSPTEDEQLLNLSRHDKMNFCPFGQKDIVLEYNTEIKAIKLDDKIFKIIVLTAVGNNDLRLEERNSPGYKRKQKQKLNDSFAEVFPEDEERPNLTRLKFEEKHHTDNDKSRQRPAGESSSFESSSFLTKNLSKKLQIALCKNKEKRPSVALLQTLEQTEDRSSSCVSQNRVIMTIKTLKQIFSRGYTSNFSRFLVFFFYCVMALLLVFAGLNFSWAKNSFYQVKNGLQIVNIANQRLTTAVDAWAKLLMILSRATDTVPNSAVTGIFQGLVYSDTLDLINENFELNEYLQSTFDSDLLNKIFDKDVHFWESSNNTITGIFEGNSFLATDFLVNKYLPLANSSQILKTALTNDYITVLNNTANDYLLSSEQTAIITQDLLNTIIYKNENSLDWILGLTCSSLAILLCILCVLAWTIVQSYNRLVLTLVKIPHHQITQRIEQLNNVKKSLSQDIHTKEFANQQIQLSKNMEPAKNANSKQVSESYYNESHWSRQILSYLIRYIGPAVLCILLIFGLSIKSVVTTRNEFNIMESVQEQLSVTTDAMYQTNMLFGNFYFLIMLQNQSNVFIRNMLPDDQIAYTLDTVQQLNSRLLNAFSDQKKSNIDPIIENMLQNNLCDYVLMSDRSPGFCEGATKGSTTGLLSLITNYYTYSSQYIELYQKNRTVSYAKGLLKPYAASTSVDLAVIYESFIFIISHVLDDLDINIEAFVRQETIQLLIMTIVIVVSTGVIRGIVKKRIQNFDLGRRRILKNLSFYTIQGNKFFRYYLVKEFHKEIASIKDIL